MCELPLGFCKLHNQGVMSGGIKGSLRTVPLLMRGGSWSGQLIAITPGSIQHWTKGTSVNWIWTGIPGKKDFLV